MIPGAMGDPDGSCSLLEFTRRFRLYDRGVDAVRLGNGEIGFTFSLFHCDDPERNDENMDYILVAAFAAADVVLSGDAMTGLDPTNFAEILDEKFEDGTLRLGIYWRDGVDVTKWTDIAISGDPLFVRETVIPIAR